MFAVRPVRAAAPAYPISATAVAVLIATSGALGCGGYAGYYDYDYGDTFAYEGIACDAVLEQVDTTLAREGWALAEQGRPVWSPAVVHLGDARVYHKATGDGELELLVVGTGDAAVHAAWTHREPTTCPVVAYAEVCDEAHCGEAIASPCAHLIQVPCPYTGDGWLLEEDTLDLLATLE